MVIKSLRLKNYRNYDLLDITFDPKVNILFGDNAQGKTNILEALYVSGTTRSHRGTKDRDIIKFGQEEAHLETVVEKEESPFQIDLHLKKNSSKGIAINKIPVRRSDELLGVVHFVFFSPEDLNMIKDGPSYRRRFLDMELSQLDRVYYSYLTDYHKILDQRNTLLKEIAYKPALEDTLDVWDMQLGDYGEKIISAREKFVDMLNGIVGDIHKKLTGNKETLTVSYEKSTGIYPLSDVLEKNRERDKKFRMTSAGPHRDDLCFMANGLDVRKFGSQGQQRTAALSLKLAEIEIVKKVIGDTPILLLDDVLSELDKNRQTYLLDSIKNVQSVITCTGLDELIANRFSMNKIFHIKNGSVVKEN